MNAYRQPDEPCPNCESVGVVLVTFRVLMNWRGQWITGTVCKRCAPLEIALSRSLDKDQPGPLQWVDHYTLGNLDRLWPQIEATGRTHVTINMGTGGRMGGWLAHLFDRLRVSREIKGMVGPPPAKPTIVKGKLHAASSDPN